MQNVIVGFLCVTDFTQDGRWWLASKAVFSRVAWYN